MKKGDVFITTNDCFEVIQGDRRVTLPANKIFTYVEEDEYDNIWVNVDGRDCIWCAGTSGHRKLPYPIEKLSTLEEYRELISQVVKEMTETFGVGVEIEANPYRVKFHIG